MATYLQQEIEIDNAGALLRRIRHAVGKYAAYILGGGSADATLIAWAKKAIPGTNADLYASMMLRSVVMDGNYSTAKTDDDASDAVLNGIVETQINNIYKNL